MKKREWIPQNKVVEDNGKFKNCPYCQGEIVQKCFGWNPPMYDDPVCKSCGKKFIPKKRWGILRGFIV